MGWFRPPAAPMLVGLAEGSADKAAPPVAQQRGTIDEVAETFLIEEHATTMDHARTRGDRFDGGLVRG